MYKKIFEGKKAVTFDLEGTIVKETEEYRKQAYEYVLRDLSLDYVDPKPYFIDGEPSREIWGILKDAYKELKKYKIDDLVEKTKENVLKIIKESELTITEGFWEILYELKVEKNFKAALVTNTSGNILKEIMSKLDLYDIFDVVISGDDVRKLKPHPEIFKKALKKMGVKAGETLAFEDSYPGVTAAGKAGIDTIVIEREGKSNKKSYEGQIVDFASDFTPYPGKMDEGYSDYLARRIIEEKDEEREISNTL